MRRSRRIKKNYFKSGDHNAICDLSGQKYKRSDLVRNWRNQLVARQHFEEKHPQLMIRPRQERIAVDDARTDPDPPVFFVPEPGDLTTQ